MDAGLQVCCPTVRRIRLQTSIYSKESKTRKSMFLQCLIVNEKSVMNESSLLQPSQNIHYCRCISRKKQPLLPCYLATMKGVRGVVVASHRFSTTVLFGYKKKVVTNTFKASFSSSTSSNDESFSSSSSNPPPPAAAVCDVVQGPSLLRTTSMARPSPSLLFLPGLRSLPFWTAPDYSRIAYGDPTVGQVVNHLESHASTIRNEYLSKTAQTEKLPPTNDYHDHQKSLHEGKWEWFSYLNKGNVQGNFVSYVCFLLEPYTHWLNSAFA